MDGEAGRTVYTCMLNREAGIEADLTVSILEAGGGGAGLLHPPFQAVLRIRIHMFLGLLDPDPLFRGMNPDPDPDPSIIMQK
jgi:hypothetical protein